MPRDPAAFTLIELLVSTAIGVVLMSLAWSGFYQMRKMTNRSRAEVELAQEAGFLYRRFDDDIARTLQQCQVRVEVVPLPPMVYGANAYAVRFIAMEEMFSTNLDQGTSLNGGQGNLNSSALWYRWEWRPPRLADLASYPQAPGSLWYARSSNWVRGVAKSVGVPDALSGSVASQSVTFQQTAQPRRSRRRLLEDNDLRLIDGAANAPGIRVPDDRADLTGDGLDPAGKPWPDPSAPVSMRMADFSIAWVDYSGWTTTATAAGVSVVDAAGVPVAAPAGLGWWTSHLRVVDGLYRDGRTAATDLGESVLGARPGLFRIDFSLYDRTTGVTRSYAFSLSPDVGAPTATGM